MADDEVDRIIYRTRKRGEATVNQVANEHPSKYPNPDESGEYLDDIDAMNLE